MKVRYTREYLGAKADANKEFQHYRNMLHSETGPVYEGAILQSWYLAGVRIFVVHKDGV